MLFGALFQLAQHERGNLRRRELAIADADADDASGFAADPERQQCRFVAHVVDAAAHESLDRVDACATEPVSSRRCASRPTKMVPVLADETRPTARARRPTRRGSRLRHAVASRRRRGCSSCRDRFLRLYPRLSAFGSRLWASRSMEREQVVDVVALEQALAQRLERRALLRGACRSLPVPLRAQCCRLRARAPRASARSACAPTRAASRSAAASPPDSRDSRISSSSSFSANTSSSSAGRHLRACRLPTSPAASPRSRAGARSARPAAQRAIRVVQIRRALQAGEPFAGAAL